MDLRTYLMIKQAGNLVNKEKLKFFKQLTNPDYSAKYTPSIGSRGTLPPDKRRGNPADDVSYFNDLVYGQPTIPDDVLANPGQALRDRGLDKAFGPDADPSVRNSLRLRGRLKGPLE